MPSWTKNKQRGKRGEGDLAKFGLRQQTSPWGRFVLASGVGSFSQPGSPGSSFPRLLLLQKEHFGSGLAVVGSG